MVPNKSQLNHWLHVFSASIWGVDPARIAGIESFRIRSGPNQELFLGSLVRYPNDQRLSFEMVVMPNDEKIEDLRLEDMQLQFVANFLLGDKVWYLFVASREGYTITPKDDDYWSELLEPGLVVGEYCPELRRGKILCVRM